MVSQVHRRLAVQGRVFFVHYGKAGGVYATTAFQSLASGWNIKNSWEGPSAKNGDWSSEELMELVNFSPVDTYIHQHHVSVTEDHIDACLGKWTTVMFYRDPREIIASLYHWSSEVIYRTSYDPIFGEKSVDRGPFKPFFERLIATHSNLFVLPEWHEKIDILLPFSLGHLDHACRLLFGRKHDPHQHKNASHNPGWMDTLTTSQLSDLTAVPGYNYSLEWVRSFHDL